MTPQKLYALANTIQTIENNKDSQSKPKSISIHLQDLVSGIANQTHVLTCVDEFILSGSVCILTDLDSANKEIIDYELVAMLVIEGIIKPKKVWLHYLDDTENYHYQYFVQE